MNTNKIIIGTITAIIIGVMAYFLVTAYFGWGYTLPVEEREMPAENNQETELARQALPPEIYLNSQAGSERIQSGQTKVLSGNINLTFKFSEPVNIDAENGFSVETADGEKVERLSIGYAGVDRKTVMLNIPPSGNQEESLRITIGRYLFFDENTELEDSAVFYFKRYPSNKADIKQVGADGLTIKPEPWITEGTKRFRLVFDRPVNKESVERAIKKNNFGNYETEELKMAFEWTGDKMVDIELLNLKAGTYQIDLTGAEDEIGLVMQGDCGVGNCWSFNVGKSQIIKTYDMASGDIEILGGKAFEEIRYFTGRIDGQEIILHKLKSYDINSEALPVIEKLRYDEITGAANPLESKGDLKEYYRPLLDKGWEFRGIKLSPDKKTIAAFISQSQIGAEEKIARLLLIDTETETIQRDMEMPFYIYAAGDGTFPMDIHFDWTGNSVIFSEGFTMYGNTSNIYGINTETGVVVSLVKNAREPRFVPGLKMLTAIKLEESEEGKIQRDGQIEQTIKYYDDSSVIVIGIYGNQLKELEPVKGYSPYTNAFESVLYDSIQSIIWSSGNKIAYPEKIENNPILLVQDLGNGKLERINMGMNFTLLGIKDGKAYILQETSQDQ